MYTTQILTSKFYIIECISRLIKVINSFNKLGCNLVSLLVKYFQTDRRRCELFTVYLSLGRGLAVNGRIRDIGQNVLQFSFQTGRNSIHSYCHIFFLIAFLQDVFIRNIIIILLINYIIIKCNSNNNNNNNNNAVNNNNLWQTPRHLFAVQNYNGHDKVCLRSLWTTGARALKKVRLACPRGCMRNLVEEEAFWIKKQLCLKQLLGFLYNQNLSLTTPQKNLLINFDFYELSSSFLCLVFLLLACKLCLIYLLHF